MGCQSTMKTKPTDHKIRCEQDENNKLTKTMCYCWTNECNKDFPPAKMGTMEKWKDVKVIEEEKRKYKKWTDASSGGNIFFNTFFTLEIVITTYTLFSGISSS